MSLQISNFILAKKIACQWNRLHLCMWLSPSQGTHIQPVATALPITAFKQRCFLKTAACSSGDESSLKLNNSSAILGPTTLHSQDLQSEPLHLAATRTKLTATLGNRCVWIGVGRQQVVDLSQHESAVSRPHQLFSRVGLRQSLMKRTAAGVQPGTRTARTRLLIVSTTCKSTSHQFKQERSVRSVLAQVAAGTARPRPRAMPTPAPLLRCRSQQVQRDPPGPRPGTSPEARRDFSPQ